MPYGALLLSTALSASSLDLASREPSCVSVVADDIAGPRPRHRPRAAVCRNAVGVVDLPKMTLESSNARRPTDLRAKAAGFV